MYEGVLPPLGVASGEIEFRDGATYVIGVSREREGGEGMRNIYPYIYIYTSPHITLHTHMIYTIPP